MKTDVRKKQSSYVIVFRSDILITASTNP